MRNICKLFVPVFVVLLASPVAAVRAEVWTATFSGTMTGTGSVDTGHEDVVFRWDPGQITTGVLDIIGRFAHGPLISAEWNGLFTGSSVGGTLDVQFRGTLQDEVKFVSGGAVADIGVFSPTGSTEFWANPAPLDRAVNLAAFGGGQGGLFGGVPGAVWGVTFIRPTFPQSISLTIAGPFEAPVPEPGTAVLIGGALLALLVPPAACRRSKGSKRSSSVAAATATACKRGLINGDAGSTNSPA